VPLINQQNELMGDASVGELQGGWYVEAAFDVMTLAPKSRWGISPYLRYEKLNTQREVPAGWTSSGSDDQEVLTAGLEVKPIPEVVLKLDHQRLKNEARTGVNRFNVALGYLF
jgi:hypothetical protein